eukprot:366311-Chlamydomonas_euryale.AAC.15
MPAGLLAFLLVCMHVDGGQRMCGHILRGHHGSVRELHAGRQVREVSSDTPSGMPCSMQHAYNRMCMHTHGRPAKHTRRPAHPWSIACICVRAYARQFGCTVHVNLLHMPCMGCGCARHTLVIVYRQRA